MKKRLTLTLALILALSLAACGDKGGNTPGGGFGDITLPGGSSSPGVTGGDATTNTPDTSTQLPDTSKPSGNLEPVLVGNYWYYTDTAAKRYYHYYFFADGTAKFYELHGGHTIVEAKYTTSDGKIYLTESYYVYDDLAGDGAPTREKKLHGNGNKVIEYATGTDEKGVYLTIANVVGVSDYAELPESPRKFRIGNEQDGPRR